MSDDQTNGSQRCAWKAVADRREWQSCRTPESLSIVKEVAAGEMTIAEAERVMALIKMHLEALEAIGFDERLQVLERCFT